MKGNAGITLVYYKCNETRPYALNVYLSLSQLLYSAVTNLSSKINVNENCVNYFAIVPLRQIMHYLRPLYIEKNLKRNVFKKKEHGKN